VVALKELVALYTRTGKLKQKPDLFARAKKSDKAATVMWYIIIPLWVGWALGWVFG
jgi:hypothetical protein